MSAVLTLSDAIAALVAEKRAVGYRYDAEARVLARFEAFSRGEFPESDTLTEASVQAWIAAARRRQVQPATLQGLAAPVRELARWLGRHGETAYLLPPAALPRPARYVPHIYTHQQLVALFAQTDRCHYCTEVPLRHLLPADFTYRHMDIDLNRRPQAQRTLRRLLAPLGSEYDRVVLDTPPSLSLVSENVIRAADVVLVPLIPTVLSVRTFDQLAAFVKQLKGRKPVLRGFFSMLDRRRRLHNDILASLPAERDQVSTVAIPSASAVEQMAVRRAPLMVFAPRSPAAVAFGQLWDEIDQLR